MCASPPSAARCAPTRSCRSAERCSPPPPASTTVRPSASSGRSARHCARPAVPTHLDSVPGDLAPQGRCPERDGPQGPRRHRRPHRCATSRANRAGRPPAASASVPRPGRQRQLIASSSCAPGGTGNRPAWRSGCGPSNPRAVAEAQIPWRFPLRLNAAELAALTSPARRGRRASARRPPAGPTPPPARQFPPRARRRDRHLPGQGTTAGDRVERHPPPRMAPRPKRHGEVDADWTDDCGGHGRRSLPSSSSNEVRPHPRVPRPGPRQPCVDDVVLIDARTTSPGSSGSTRSPRHMASREVVADQLSPCSKASTVARPASGTGPSTSSATRCTRSPGSRT